MILLERLVATIVAAAWMLGFAVLFAMLDRRFAAVRAGVSPPPWRQPWIDLVALSRKRRLRPAMASPWYTVWPVIALAASGSAALILPGFMFATLTTPLATAPVLVGLFALAVAARLAASLESGEGARGLAASLAARRLMLGCGVWLTAFAVRAETARTGAIGVAALAGLAAVLTLPCFSLAEPADYAGPERGLFRLEAALRLPVMLAAVIVLVGGLPIADAARLETWLPMVAAWTVALAGLGAVVLWCAPRRFAIGSGVASAVLAATILVVQTTDRVDLMLACGAGAGLAGLVRLARGHDPAESAGLIQIGIALAGFGLDADAEALLILAIVVLAQLAWVVARSGRIAQLALVAMVGLPPFGGFAGDFAVVRAGFAADRWIGGTLLGVWAIMAVMAIRRLPPPGDTARRRGSIALAALAVTVALGIMPALPAWLP